MSRQSPHPSARGLNSSSPAHKTPRSLNQSPRQSNTSITPALTSAVAPGAFHYRSSSHADSFVRRAQADLPDDEHNVVSATATVSPVAASSPAITTPSKGTRRVAPTAQPIASTSSSSTVTPAPSPTSAPSSPLSSLQPADPSTWEDDDFVVQCRTCSSRFTLFLRKHHCRQCGRIFCDNCSRGRRRLRHSTSDEVVRVCDGCERMLLLEDESDRASNRQQPQASKPATPTQSPSIADVMAAMSLSGDSIDGTSSAVSGGSRLSAGGGVVVDCAPLIASLLAEVECAERLRRVQDRMRDEMDAMLRLLVAEMSAGSGKPTVEVDVVR